MSGQARETMEAHLYAFLTQRFGLRPLILSALAGLLAALARHSAADADVDLFGRVLRCVGATVGSGLGITQM